MLRLGLDFSLMQLRQPMASAHQHFDIELNLVTDGRLDLFAGGSRVRLGAGDAAVFWAAYPHQILDVGTGVRFAWVTVELPRLLAWGLPGRCVDRLLRGEVLVDHTPPQYTGDPAALERWDADRRSGELARQPSFALEVEARIRRLAEAASHSASRPARRPAGALLPERVERMARYIAERHAGPIGAEDIARAAGLHPSYAAAQLRRHFGYGPKEYLARQRIGTAQRLLVSTAKTVLEVAYESGFQSPARFYHWFRRLTGEAPEAFRGRMRP